MPSGIFKPAYLVTLSPKRSTKVSTPASHPLLASSGSVFLEETSLEISKVGQTSITPADQSADWVVNLTLAIRSVVSARSPTVSVSIPELRVSSGPLHVDAIPEGTNASTVLRGSFTVPEGVPKRWFPHNLGSPQLYDFVISLSIDNGEEASFVTRSGFRTIELVQTPYSQEEINARGITPGDQWHFSVNGKAFYTLGTNIIPFDPFYARMTSAQVRWVLESAVRSGQNMVRLAPGFLVLILRSGDVDTGHVSDAAARVGRGDLSAVGRGDGRVRLLRGVRRAGHLRVVGAHLLGRAVPDQRLYPGER